VKRALGVIDLINSFRPGWDLPVDGMDEIIKLVNEIMESGHYDVIVLVCDWHPKEHCSFVVWKRHGEAGTPGAEFHPDLNLLFADMILRKGTDVDVDCTSAFASHIDASGMRRETGLDGYLRSLGVTDIDFCGVALEVCVADSAVDGVARGYRTRVLRSCTRSINPANDVATIAKLKATGVKIIDK
jgi:nicotinamidase/pyrazinamidase